MPSISKAASRNRATDHQRDRPRFGGMQALQTTFGLALVDCLVPQLTRARPERPSGEFFGPNRELHEDQDGIHLRRSEYGEATDRTRARPKPVSTSANLRPGQVNDDHVPVHRQEGKKTKKETVLEMRKGSRQGKEWRTIRWLSSDAHPWLSFLARSYPGGDSLRIHGLSRAG
jgi:hypothetical protein